MHSRKISIVRIYPVLVLMLLGWMNVMLAKAHGADVFAIPSNISQDKCSDFMFVISGEISRGDDLKLSRSLKGLKSRIPERNCADNQLTIQLISNGGDVEAALSLGRLIRQHEMRIIVPADSSCLSSCVLVLAGGVDRVAFGKIGIHRPYFENLSDRASIPEIKKKREVFLSMIRAYLVEMDVSPSLLDLMLSKSPERMRFLSIEELKELRLFGKDANFEEREVAKQAKFWNLTSSDYREKNRIVERNCPSVLTDFSGHNICQIQTMLSIARSEARRRYERSEKCLDGPDNEYFRCLRRYFLDEIR